MLMWSVLLFIATALSALVGFTDATPSMAVAGRVLFWVFLAMFLNAAVAWMLAQTRQVRV